MSGRSDLNANADLEGRCCLAQTAEIAGPDIGDPCEDGRDAKLRLLLF